MDIITIRNMLTRLPFLALILVLQACDFEVATTPGGKVISDPAGINCRHNSGTCIVEDYEKLGDSNDAITTKLTAIPDNGYRFSHWKGCDRTSLLNCYKEMSGNIYIEAHFAPLAYETENANPGSIRFVAMGDFGMGNAEQKIVADAVAATCNSLGGCDFAVGLGDNIYDENPQSPYDDAFERKFEHPFVNIHFPFYMTLGNHDNSLIIDGLGNFNMTGDVQVQYSYRNDRLSNKWVMPARYYQHSHPANTSSPLAEFFTLDSNPFMSAIEINPQYMVDFYKWEQGNWVQNAIAGSNASWKIAASHHPLISNGSHGNAGNYDGIIPLELFTTRLSGKIFREWIIANICDKVDIFISGHDHDVQLLYSIPECGKTIFVISGAAAKTRPLDDTKRNPAYYQKGNTLGFVITEIEGNKAKLKFYTVNALDGSATLAKQKAFLRRKSFY